MGGLSIFMMAYGTSAVSAQARERGHVYEMLHAGQTAATLDQIRELVATAPQMAQSVLELIRSFQAYTTLLEVLLGQNHRVPTYFRLALLEPFQARSLDVQQLVPSAMLPLFQRYVQLAFAQYFRTAGVMGAATRLPPVEEIIDIINMRRWSHLPPMPPRYLAPLTPAPGPPAAPSSAPPPSGFTPPAAKPEAKPVAVTNIKPNVVLQQRFLKHGKALKDIIAGHSEALPKADDGTNFLCLSHALRSNCISNCRRRMTHRGLSAAEVARVGAFLTQVGCSE